MKQSALLDEALVAAAVLCSSFFVGMGLICLSLDGNVNRDCQARNESASVLARCGAISVKKCGGL